MKNFKTGLVVGRFQHIHKGHEMLINIGLDLCDTLLVFVSSSDKYKDVRNPYSINYRMKLIYKIYKDEIDNKKIILCPLADLTCETDLTYEWGDYVIKTAEAILNKKLDCIVYGKDKNIDKCFSKDTMSCITEVFVDRKKINISATKLRESLKNDDEKIWKKYTNEKIHGEYLYLKEGVI
ncbi:MAG: cytidyltransferase [Clostridia bacterium]